MNQFPADIQVALISHTNAGKTALARTMIGIDVGEVRDAPHVTTLAESYPLLSTPTGDRLMLWDTPGFGDSVRLAKRLAMTGNPIGWFLSEVVDRYLDRPFWLSQQAVRAARDSADVALYLVNAAEDPADAGYLAPEMQLLQWLGKPVLILLNQMGPPRPFAEEQAEQARWEQLLQVYPVVRQVIALDAFARCWVHERMFFCALGALLPAAKKDAYARLVLSWEQENASRLRQAMRLLAQLVLAAACDLEPVDSAGSGLVATVLGALSLGGKPEHKRQEAAMDALIGRLQASTSHATAALLQLYRLDAGVAPKIDARVASAFVLREPLSTTRAGLLGAAISAGAAKGLALDASTGGLSHGLGTVLGGLLGALTFAGAAFAFNASTDRGAPKVQFSDEMLRNQVLLGLLRYLAVIHFGRGRGRFEQAQAPAFWLDAVQAAVAARDHDLAELWRGARAPAGAQQAGAALEGSFSELALQILETLYPAPPGSVSSGA